MLDRSTETNFLLNRRKYLIKVALEKISGKKLPGPGELAKLTGSSTDKGNLSRILNGRTKEPGLKYINVFAKFLEIEKEKVMNVFIAAIDMSEDDDVEEILKKLCPNFEIPENMPSDLRYFVGREEELEEIKNKLLITKKNKVIGIIGFPGTGKTTFVNRLIRSLHKEVKGKFTAVSWVALNPQEGTGKPPSFKEIVNSILSTLSQGEITREVTSQDNCVLITERLLSQLKRQNCLIVIDNAETVLSNANSGEAGTFSEECSEYAYLFKQILIAEHSSKLLLTSRESFVELKGSNYSEVILQGLTSDNAIELILNLSKEGIESGADKLEGTDRDFRALAEHYLGNPKALELAVPMIQKDPEFRRSIRFFLEQSPPIGFNSLLREVMNRLNDKQINCLTRVSVYQTQDYPLYFNGIYRQMDLNKDEVKEIIEDLKFKQLLESDGQPPAYKIHPFIKENSYKLLDIETINKAHLKAAEFYIEEAGNFKDIQEVNAAFQAVYHFYQARSFDDCYETLIVNILNGEQLDNLRCSANLWNNVDRIIEVIPKIVNELSEPQVRAIALVPLGFVYSEAGQNLKALKVSEKILKITNNREKTSPKLTFAHIAANLNAARVNRFIGDFDKSKKFCEIATESAKQSKNLTWQALALYELGLIDLELEKPVRAIGCFITAAFKAIGETIVKSGVHSYKKRFLSGKEGKIEELIADEIMNYSKGNSEDHTKKFRILFNIGKGLNLLKRYKLAKIILDIASRFVADTDMGSPIWLYTELAACYIGMEKPNKGYEYLKEAYSRKEKAPMICNALTLCKYAQWEYDWKHYDKALKKYEELEQLLREAEFPLWQMQAHYGQANCYYNLYTNPNSSISGSKEKAVQHIKKAREICDKWSLPSLTEVNKLERKIITPRF